MRSLRAGAHGYYVAEAVTALGAFISARAEVRASAATPAEALEPGEDELDAVIDEIILTGRRPQGGGSATRACPVSRGARWRWWR